MHAVHTFILRLLVDSAEPEVLRGDLRQMPEGEISPFANELTLLGLLHQGVYRLVEAKTDGGRGETLNESLFTGKNGANK
jgi:hypothetical protein